MYRYAKPFINKLQLEEISLDQLHYINTRFNALLPLQNKWFGSRSHALYALFILAIVVRVISSPHQEEVCTEQSPTSSQVFFVQTNYYLIIFVY